MKIALILTSLSTIITSSHGFLPKARSLGLDNEDFYITLKSSSRRRKKCLTAEHDKDYVKVFDCDDEEHKKYQKWFYEAGYIKNINWRWDGKCLTWDTFDNSSAVKMYDCSNLPTQYWTYFENHFGSMHHVKSNDDNDGGIYDDDESKDRLLKTTQNSTLENNDEGRGIYDDDQADDSNNNDVSRKGNDDDDDDDYSDCEKDMFCMEKDDNKDKVKAKKCSQNKNNQEWTVTEDFFWEFN